MTRDLIIGILLSAILHGGFLFGDQLMPKKKVVAAKKVEEDTTIELMQMPTPEPEEPEPVESAEEASAEVAELAPPMAADVPSVVTVDSFVQKLQPPPPPGMTAPSGVITIPKGPTGGAGNFGKGMKDLFDINNLDQVPQPKFRAQPVYPFEMKRSGISGEVTVGFIVNAAGDVQDAYAVKSTQREFEAPAIQAVMKWKFRPGKKGGRNVNTKMQVPIVFSITDN